METRANFILIGAFTLSAVAGVFLLVLWMSGAGQVSQSQTYQIMFTGSVSGLARGGPVLFNGLRVGEVKQINFVPNDPGRVVALVDVQPGIPIKRDTQARLELQGLTGGSVISLIGGAADAAPLLGKDGAPPVIIAEPSQIQNLLESVRNISAKADSVLGKVDTLLSDNGPALSDTLRNIDAFSKALGDNSAGVKDALAGVADLGRKIGPLAARLESLSTDADKLLEAVDPQKVKRAVSDAAAFMSSLGDAKGPVQSMLADSASLAKRLNESSVRLDSALADVDTLVKAFDVKKVSNLVDGAGALGDALKQNRDNIDRMIRNASDTLKNASELAAKLNASADKVDSLMTSLQGFVGSPDVKGPMAEVGDAAKSIHELADDLNVRTRDIAAGLAKFTGSGLREYEALAIDGRRTINDVDRVVRGFEKNPSQLIFGAKPSLPEFHGGN